MTPYSYSIKLLSKKDYSLFKLKNKLYLKGFDELSINQSIDLLVEKNLFKENNYIEEKVKSLALRIYSNSYIVQKLATEEIYIDYSQVQKIKEEYQINSDQLIQEAIKKKISNQDISSDSVMKLRSRVASYLASKGYDYEQIEIYLPRELQLDL